MIYTKYMYNNNEQWICSYDNKLMREWPEKIHKTFFLFFELFEVMRVNGHFHICVAANKNPATGFYR